MKLVLRNHTENFGMDIFQQVSDHEKREYGEGNHREPIKLKKFADANPEGFVVLIDEDTNKVMGMTDFYPLDPVAWQGLADGVIIEEKIPSAAVLKGSNHFYIASLIVAEPSRGSFIGTPILFRRLMRYVFASLGSHGLDLKILSVGSTPKGKILLENYRFMPHEGSPHKKDFRPRFVLDDESGQKCQNLAKKYGAELKSFKID